MILIVYRAIIMFLVLYRIIISVSVYMLLYTTSNTVIELLSNESEQSIQTKPTVMVVLGCAMEDLQKDRIENAVKYASTVQGPVTWFLTGGVKNAIKNEIKNAIQNEVKNEVNNEIQNEEKNSEADNMAKFCNSGANLVLDTKATNTAENFANLKQWAMNEYSDTPPDFVITTSEFHEERASKIFDGIFGYYKVNVTWNTSKGACLTCWNDEKIHMRNVNADVLRALAIHRM